MKLSNFMEGLQILRAHFNDDGDGYHIGSEHDQFYVYKTDTPLSDEEYKLMRSLGWFQPELEDGAPYNADEGWSAFT
jgi:hypothetical protein